ncbi:MAG: transaldolase / glucose-6-phosphate isomerase [Chloroflexota bacterium]|jgi:glucose-6-phosphate isomerase|nr:transaldolase / glucose-6-phosphate isomerase [Chloroflexota bacterium]
MTYAAGHSRRLPAALEKHVAQNQARAIDEDWAGRLWARDPSLWTKDEEVAALIANRLGWLDLPTHFTDDVEALAAFARGIRDEGFDAALVCGMGGSSLAPDVLAASFPVADGGIPVRILDSTDPAAVAEATAASDPARTLYLISTKSGTTTETLAFLAHFWQAEDDIHADIPQGLAGQHFAAVTDPPPSLDAIPHSDLMREVFLNPADVGGRYSALSYVGLVPAALMGLDLRAITDAAAQMAEDTRSPSDDNPGVWLGTTLGALARAGRDKLTLVIEPAVARLGAWIEQLVAESTGKHGVGIVPVDSESLGTPDAYGDDRVFVRISSGANAAWQSASGAALDSLVAAGHPVIDLALGSGIGGLGAEFFRWEFATAVAGIVLGINPFDEPNVTESKDNTKRVLEAYGRTGNVVLPAPLAADDLANALRRHLERAKSDGYFAIQAYIAPSAARDQWLSDAAGTLRDASGRAVTTGYGPRFLHSTGQLHKGGAPLGCFIQLTAAHGADLPIPGSKESFGTLIDAQAAGDFASLEAHGLPVARIDLGIDTDAGLNAFVSALKQAAASPLE